jgi:RNA-directed DNA polymerase
MAENIVILGIDQAKYVSALQAVSSLSYWRMARTPVTQQAMSNTWLKAQGLLSVKDLWCKAQGYSA